MKFKIVIPARYASVRLPGKPLRELCGKPMVQHVHACAVASGAEEVIVATDDERIERAVKAFGGDVCMTRADHTSGTDRIEEVARLRAWSDDTIVVNLQGDEPMMPPKLLVQVAEGLADHPDASIATLHTPLEIPREVFDPNVVKVVCDKRGFALMFSRAPIPWEREAFSEKPPRMANPSHQARHIGLYAYRVGFLKRFVDWPICELETAESLEQLRALWNGDRIYVEQAVVMPGHGIDTPADLETAEALLQEWRPAPIA